MDFRRFKKAIVGGVLPLVAAALMGFAETGQWDFDEVELLGIITSGITAYGVYAVKNLENRLNQPPQERGRFAGE